MRRGDLHDGLLDSLAGRWCGPCRGQGCGRRHNLVNVDDPSKTHQEDADSASAGMLCGVTTWTPECQECGAPGSAPWACMTTWQARRRSRARSWCSTADSRPVWSSVRFSASRSWARNALHMRPASAKAATIAALPPVAYSEYTAVISG